MVSGSSSKSKSRPTSGKKKIEIKKIDTQEKLQVCFSKRRHGLFKKATELVTLCGAEVLILTFSPAGHPYSLGLPDVEVVLDRLGEHGDYLPADPLSESRMIFHRAALARPLNQKLMEVNAHLDIMRGQQAPRERHLKECAMAADLAKCGRDFDLEGMQPAEIFKLQAAMEHLRGCIGSAKRTMNIPNDVRAQQMRMQQAAVDAGAGRFMTGAGDFYPMAPTAGAPSAVNPLQMKAPNGAVFPLRGGLVRTMGLTPANFTTSGGINTVQPAFSNGVVFSDSPGQGTPFKHHEMDRGHLNSINIVNCCCSGLAASD